MTTFKHILLRLGSNLLGQWKTLLCFGFVGLFVLAIAFGPRLLLTSSALSSFHKPTCDEALIATITGAAGDDQQLVDCFKDSTVSSKPTTATEAASVRQLQARQHLTAERIGSFVSNNGTAVVWAIRDGYPETMYTVFLSSEGMITTVQ